MDLSNTFTVDLPVDAAWRVLTDLERVAPCMPGAALLGVEDGVYRGAVKIKVGPVSAKYQGTARFVERDDGAHRAVLRAEGKDAGGQGNAAATVTATLTAQGSGTKVDVRTDLALSGRVAQFGRGVIADVTGKLLGQFVQRLEAEVASAAPVKPVNLDDVEPLDVMASVGGTVAKRAVPVAAVALLLVVLVILQARKGKAAQ
ncbi:SRPBCC family protein [Amycolatopsis sp. DSM 110486]|uniref:SRPBCC family protein n=1 Tax=Amycolatopsis sp. DSM 110486 TaxID=2865832 RepID=UPI001C6943A0|nr:SRPBCC family protein [Amycolatopsis sp. DSM 110486]QYN23873.1 SRPBCC family protein [Amycolatopsis sp. DSM 110486]